MKTILSTILFVLSSFFISAQNLEFIVQSDNCQCVYLQVVGEGIDFIVQGITINGPNGFSMHVQEGNICDYFLDEGEYTVYVEVFVIDSQDLWIDEQSFFIFQEYIEIFPTSICDEPINSTSGGCATTYANELATYEVNAFNSIYGFDVTGGEIISQNSNQVTVLWGDTGQGSISAFGDCSDGYLCVNPLPLLQKLSIIPSKPVLDKISFLKTPVRTPFLLFGNPVQEKVFQIPIYNSLIKIQVPMKYL